MPIAKRMANINIPIVANCSNIFLHHFKKDEIGFISFSLNEIKPIIIPIRERPINSNENNPIHFRMK